MVSGSDNQMQRTFDEKVAYHQHRAIQSALNELISEEPSSFPPLHPFNGIQSTGTFTKSPESPVSSVSSLESPSTIPSSFSYGMAEYASPMYSGDSTSVKRFCKV